jgi:cytochrome c553
MRIGGESRNLPNHPVATGLLLAAGIAVGNPASAAEPSAEALSLPCAGCHGVNGVSAGDCIPTIAGLPKGYLAELVLKTKGGSRHATILVRLAKGYSDSACRAIAAFFAAQKWVSAEQQVDPKLAAHVRKSTKRSVRSVMKTAAELRRRTSLGWPDRRPFYCASSWRPWMTAGWWSYRRRPTLTAARQGHTACRPDRLLPEGAQTQVQGDDPRL